MGRKVLILIFVICVQFGEVFLCFPSGGVVPGLEKSVQFLETVSTALSERKEDSEGNILPITASITFFKGLAKLSSMAGAVLGVVGFVFDQFQESDYDKMKKEFGKVNQGISDLKFRFDELSLKIEQEAAWTRIHPNLQKLNAISTILDRALNSRNPETKKESKKKLLAYYKQNDIFNSVDGVYYDVIGKNPVYDLVDILYRETNGDWAEINIVCQYISGLLVQGHLAFTSACVMQRVDEEGLEAEDARMECLNISDDYFKTDGQLYEDKFEKVLSKCKTEMMNNLQTDIDKIVRDAYDRDQTPNSIVGDRIVNLIRKKYFWMDASVIVYDDDVRGYNRHTFICSLYHKFDHGRTWCVMLRYKPEYRNPFTSEDELPSADTKYFPSVVSQTEFASVGPAADEKFAEEVFDKIWKQLEYLGIQIFELAVVRSRVVEVYEVENHNVYTTSTDKEQHLIQEYNTGDFIIIDGSVMDYTNHFIVMISFNWEYVSLAMECPPAYPYVFHFGKFCTKSHSSWFTEHHQTSYLSCPANICRTRTGGRLNQKMNLSGLMVEFKDSFSFEMISSFLTILSIKLTLMTMMICLLILFYCIKFKSSKEETKEVERRIFWPASVNHIAL